MRFWVVVVQKAWVKSVAVGGEELVGGPKEPWRGWKAVGERRMLGAVGGVSGGGEEVVVGWRWSGMGLLRAIWVTFRCVQMEA
jgi:hypothetical protein